jgi:hypothetical protein
VKYVGIDWAYRTAQWCTLAPSGEISRVRYLLTGTGSPGSCSNFHRLEHLSSWKTLLHCPQTERAVVDYLRSPAPAYLLPFRAETAEQVAA